MSFITAIIPSLPDVDKYYVKVCVESLRDSGFDGDVIVVANGTKSMKPFAPLYIRGISKEITIKSQGQCYAVNQAAKMAEPDCRYLFVINSDMYFPPGWDKYLGEYRESRDNEGRPTGNFSDMCLSPNLVEPTNNVGSAKPFLKVGAGFTLEEFDREVADDFIETKVKKIHEQQPNDLLEPGFNLPFIIDIDLWRTVGGYDTRYDPWGSNSDTDLQTLINIAGVTPMRMRDVLVYHFSNKSGTFDGTHQEEWLKNFDYYRQKFGYTRDEEPQADVWYNTNMVLEDKLKFHPEWENKYADS